MCCRGQTLDEVKNDDIERTLQIDNKTQSNVIKLLLLGAGESGKSTVAKQMKIIHKNGFSEEELLSFSNVIHSNIYQAIRTMIQALDDLNVQVSAAHKVRHDLVRRDSQGKDILSSFRTPFVDKLTPEMGEMITTLWKDPGFVEIYSRRSEYQLIDSID
eukprot:TRINITY_DN3665_c0_g1_i19.p1 TRINITY_DN3665_c0_g1~~TRINITY_DN3665_c0_g1_i19.p1  ORF type:complete len:159 (+),score=22.59 TRINITY_DN3665_c0_g1_i19:98-574(+)